MPTPDFDPIADDLANQVEAQAQAAYERTIQAIRGGADPRKAVEAALEGFIGPYATALAAAYSAVLQREVTAGSILAMRVGEVVLSTRLYRHARQTAMEVAAIVRQHAQGLQQARELALRLYDGYNPADGVKRPLEGRARADLPKALRALTADPEIRRELTAIMEQGQAQAGRLKSEALRAAYTQALDAWMAGKGQEALNKRLWVAEREKTRFLANRIAQTELKRTHTDAVAREFMQDEELQVVEVRLGPRHPVPDICDVHARANLFGLGPGLYPKAKAPKPGFHPWCRCKLISRPDLDDTGAKLRPDAVRDLLASMPPAEAARVMGSREKLQAVMGGRNWETVTQAGIPQEYRLRRIGEG